MKQDPDPNYDEDYSLGEYIDNENEYGEDHEEGDIDNIEDKDEDINHGDKEDLGDGEKDEVSEQSDSTSFLKGGKKVGEVGGSVLSRDFVNLNFEQGFILLLLAK